MGSSLRWIGGGLLLGMACGGSSAGLMNSTSGTPVEVPPGECVPGQTQPCDCSAQLGGLQTCLADGSAFGECDCSPAAMSQGPPPTGTGTSTGTGTAGTADTTANTTANTTAGLEGSSTVIDPSSSGPPDPTTGGSTSGTSGGSG
ncbi:MAG: hypothetical protein AAGF11_24720 [Myxococcota bacterium]